MTTFAAHKKNLSIAVKKNKFEGNVNINFYKILAIFIMNKNKIKKH